MSNTQVLHHSLSPITFSCMFEHSQEAIQDLSKQLELAHSVTKKLEVQALNSAVHHKRINEEVGEPCSCCLTSEVVLLLSRLSG